LILSLSFFLHLFIQRLEEELSEVVRSGYLNRDGEDVSQSGGGDL